MFSPLLETIIEREDLPVVNEDELQALCNAHETVALMVCGDYKRVSTVNDMAVIFPELMKEFSGQFKACVASRDQEAVFQSNYGFVLLPTLVFLKNGEKMDVISGIYDWDEFVHKVDVILNGPQKSHGQTHAAE